MQEKYIDELLYFIHNDIILKDGTIKRFDIVDYYQHFDENIIDLYKEYYKNDIVRSNLRKFIIENLGNICFNNPNIENSKLNLKYVQQLLESKIVMNVAFDDKGKYIEGSGYTISDEEKQEAYEFLMSNNGFVTEKGLNTIFKRIANGYPINQKGRTMKR